MFPRVQIQHEVGQRALQASSQIPIHRKPRSRHFRAALQIEDSQLRSDIPMRLRLKVELARRTPAMHFNIRSFVPAFRNAFLRKIGNTCQEVAKLAVELTNFLI